MYDVFRTIRRDLVHAVRSLAKAQGFTFVCVISPGIGMGAMVALATFTRLLTAPARVVDTNGLTELLVLPQGQRGDRGHARGGARRRDRGR